MLFNTNSLYFLIVFLFSSLLLATTAMGHDVNDGQQKSALKIRKISKNLYLHTSFQHITNYGLVPANGVVLVTDEKHAYIIDTPWDNNDTQALVHWIKNQGFTVKGSISTHFHQDTAGGIAYLNQHSIPTFASAKTNNLLKQNKKALATNELHLPLTNLANEQIEVFYPGAGHSRDNIVVWLPKQKLLFAGCLVKSLSSKTLGNTADADLAQWPNSIENIIQRYPAIKQLVPGHGLIGNNQLLTHTTKLLAAHKNKKVISH